MKFYIVNFFLVLIYIAAFERSAFSFYHTTQQIDEELGQIAPLCLPSVNITIHSSKEIPLLKFFDITSSTDNKKDNVFILAGEHAREIISPELAYHFIIALCKDKDYSELLKENNFRIIVNANPNGREKVEKGDYCVRTNDNNVDLNRNWNYRWSNANGDNDEENPGPSPFSEIETKFIKTALTEYNAKIFLSIHSGAYGLFHPYASSNKKIKNKSDLLNMVTVLKSIQSKYCKQCVVGSPAETLNYFSYGNCLDYAYEVLKIPYSFAWEIYSGDTMNEELNVIKEKNQMRRMLRKNKQSVMSSFVEKNYSQKMKDRCVDLFNPLDRTSYEFIIDRFKKGIVDMVKYANKN